MSPAPAAAALATAATEKLRELPMPPWTFGAIALVTFMVLLGVLWSFRHTAAKYDTATGGQGGARDPRPSYGATDHEAPH